MLKPLIPRRQLRHRQPPAMAIRKPGSLIKPFNRISPSNLGPDLIVNGGFDTATVWTLGAGWTIAGGILDGVPPTQSKASQPLTLNPGARYLCVVDVAAIQFGFCSLFLGGLQGQRVITQAGIFRALLLCGTSDSLFAFQKDPPGNPDINSVTLQEVLP